MKYPIYLNDEQRSHLETMISSGHHSSRVTSRARILLLADRSLGSRREDTEVAEAAMLCTATVRRIRKEFALGGLDCAIYDKPRPGAKPKITGDVEARLVALACSTPPEGRDSWTCQLLADELVELRLVESISAVAVHQRLKNALKPWQVDSWCIPEASAKFVCKTEDVLDVYQRPYDPKYPVACIDEKSKQLFELAGE